MDLLPTSICYRLLLNWLVRNWKTK
jgi:hypothetical protein